MPSSVRLFRIVIHVLLVALAAPLSSRAVEPERIVATGGRIGSSFYTPPAGSTAFWQRTPHQLGGPVSEIQVGFMDWIHSTTAEAPNTLNEVTITHAWIERASTGQVVPLTFSGQRALVLPVNGTAPCLLADAIPASAWTGAALARDERFWVHAKGTIPADGKIPVGTPATYPGSRFIVYNPANDPGTRDFSGAVPTIVGSGSRVTGLPLVFLGRFTGPGHLAVIGIGDSILDGSGDATNPVKVVSGFGFFNRAAVDQNGANTLAMFNLTRHGETAATWVGHHVRQAWFLPFANVVVEEFGTNDLGTNGTGTPSAIIPRLESIWATARAAGVQKILRTKLLPRTVSTSYNWTSFEDQVPNPGWGAAGKRDEINASFAAALTAGKIDVLVDTLSAVAHPGDDHYWRFDGTNDYLTADGTHPGARGYEFLAVPLRAALLALTVDADRLGYAGWSGGISWGGADPAPLADPNSDGVSNFLAYALDLSPLASNAPGGLPVSIFDSSTAGGPWLGLEYRQNTAATDLVYSVESSPDLVGWTKVVIDGSAAVSEIADANPDGDGSSVRRRVRVKLTADEPRRFLRLQVNR